MKALARRRRQRGATLVEFAVCASVLMTLMFGLVELCVAQYSYHFVAEAAREATRWAMVRGSNSCSNTPNLTACDATAAQIQAYVQGLGFPAAAGLGATTTWLTASATKPTTWSVCASGTCNLPGNQVQVVVTYNYQLGIPFWNVKSLAVTATAASVIAQ